MYSRRTLFASMLDRPVSVSSDDYEPPPRRPSEWGRLHRVRPDWMLEAHRYKDHIKPDLRRISYTSSEEEEAAEEWSSHDDSIDQPRHGANPEIHSPLFHKTAEDDFTDQSLFTSTPYPPRAIAPSHGRNTKLEQIARLEEESFDELEKEPLPEVGTPLLHARDTTPHSPVSPITNPRHRLRPIEVASFERPSKVKEVAAPETKKPTSLLSPERPTLHLRSHSESVIVNKTSVERPSAKEVDAPEANSPTTPTAQGLVKVYGKPPPGHPYEHDVLETIKHEDGTMMPPLYRSDGGVEWKHPDYETPFAVRAKNEDHEKVHGYPSSPPTPEMSREEMEDTLRQLARLPPSSRSSPRNSVHNIVLPTVPATEPEDTMQGLDIPTSAPKTEPEYERVEEVKHIHAMGARLRTARTSLRDADRGMRRVQSTLGPEDEVKVEDESSVESRWQFQVSRLVHYEFRIPAWAVGLLFLAILVWWMVELSLCSMYCQPWHAVRMKGFGVDPNAPVYPYVLPTLIGRSLYHFFSPAFF